jgi:thioredoxin-dependent peroxiredoxin
MNLRKLLPLLGALAFAFASVSLTTMHAEPLAVGATAPRVTASDQDGKPVDLGALYDRGYVLVFFYPKADTSGCTAQACSLRDAYEELTKQGVTVVGVSVDPATAQKAFQAKHSLPYVLIADPERKVVDAFGVPLTTSGLASRQAFLIKEGKVVWCDLKASTAQQAADVLAALAKLSSATG